MLSNSSFLLFTIKRAVKCGCIAMKIIAIMKHCMLHDKTKQNKTKKNEIKQIDWRESKMLPPVTSCCFMDNTNVFFLLLNLFSYLNLQTLVQFP